MSNDPFANYRTLVARVDEHTARVAASTPLRCARGCTACCYVDLSVSRVEADLIARSRPVAPSHAGRGALDDHPRFDALRGPAPCVFLGPEGDCAIYPVRPLICRSHGIPVQTGAGVDACPLNGELEGVSALNLELLNTTLAAIDGLYCRETGRPPGRVRLRDLSKVDIP